ncbi:MAG: response regulator [Thermodesulfobacteriota bacterium]
MESQVGVGTTFSIYLPAASRPHVPTASTGDTPAQGSGHVLLMDDNEAIRALAGDLLEELGYEVTAAEDGLKAIERYTECLAYGRPFDAVILDLTVPGGMGGKDTILQLRKLDSGVKAIVSSGYSNDPVMANYRDYGFQGVLVKPYGIAAISSLLHRLLDRGNGKMPTALGRSHKNQDGPPLAEY